MAIVHDGLHLGQQDDSDIPDRNKREETLRITEAASGWLHGIGAKAVETEVPLAKGWVADLAAFWVPTRTEAQAAKILPRCPRSWNYGDSPERNASAQGSFDAWMKEFRSLPDYITIAHEVKVSSCDFRRDAKWVREPVADMQVLSFLRGAVSREQVPSGWWGIEHADNGHIMKVTQRVPVRHVSVEQRLKVIAAIAERRHNRTANQFHRALQKKWTVEARESEFKTRFRDSFRTIMAVLHAEHGSVEECITHFLNDRAVKTLPSDVLKDLRDSFGILLKITGKGAMLQ